MIAVLRIARCLITSLVRLLLLVVIAAAAVPSLAQTPGAGLLKTSKPQSAAQSPEQKPAAEPAKTPAEPDPNQPIALPDIADRAEALDRQLREFCKELEPSPEQLAADTSIQSQAAEIRQRSQQLEAFLAGTPNPMELQEEDRYWRALGEQYTSYRKLLSVRAAKLQEQVRALDSATAQWQATLTQIKNNKGIEAVVERVNRALREIREAQAKAQAELNRVLNLQTQVSQYDQQIAASLLSLGEIRDRLRGRVFQRDSPPLWRVSAAGTFDDSLATIAYRSAGRSLMGAREFLAMKGVRLITVAVLYLVALLLALRFKHDIGMGKFAELPPEAPRLFGRPYSIALLIALLGTIGQSIAAPSGIVFILYLLYCLAIIRITPLLTDPRVSPLLYALTGFGLLEGFYLVIQVSPLLRRELFAGVVLAAICTFLWLTRPAAIRGWDLSQPRLRVALTGVRLALAFLAASLLANILGFVLLSQVVGVAALLGAFAAVLLLTLVRVLSIMLALGLQTWASSLGKQREGLERWGRVALTFAGLGLWVDTVLYLFTVHDTVAAAMARAMKYEFGLAKVHIVVGDLLSALLALAVGYILANVIAFVLREFVLARMRLSRGLPHAISTIVYYLLLVLVYLAAVSELGLELNKFTLVTGALGVGVGFGLQTTVSNFVSGLILLFERPIRVGDVVEAAGVTGTVRRIGVRSSTIHTFDDAEVILPNNDLISNKVTNWTLSSPRRRVDIPVGVAYGTDPGRMLKLLVSVAEADPGILRHPRPVAFFLGFGESTLNFELRFWSTQETWFQLKSDVTVALAKALAEAGIETPFPQRDLRLRAIDGGTRRALELATDNAVPAAAGRKK